MSDLVISIGLSIEEAKYILKAGDDPWQWDSSTRLATGLVINRIAGKLDRSGAWRDIQALEKIH